MVDFDTRTRLLIGRAGVARLQAAHVLLFGVGGVGGSCAEALVRAGVGALTLVDGDVYCESNLNRQNFLRRIPLGRAKWRSCAGNCFVFGPIAVFWPSRLSLQPAMRQKLIFRSMLLSSTLWTTPRRNWKLSAARRHAGRR